MGFCRPGSEYVPRHSVNNDYMNAILKEILRNVKRHRGEMAWHEPARDPETGEVRGFKWALPNQRSLVLTLDPQANTVRVDRESPELPEAELRSYILPANDLVKIRALYRWVAGGPVEE